MILLFNLFSIPFHNLIQFYGPTKLFDSYRHAFRYRYPPYPPRSPCIMVETRSSRCAHVSKYIKFRDSFSEGVDAKWENFIFKLHEGPMGRAPFPFREYFYEYYPKRDQLHISNAITEELSAVYAYSWDDPLLTREDRIDIYRYVDLLHAHRVRLDRALCDHSFEDSGICECGYKCEHPTTITRPLINYEICLECGEEITITQTEP